MMVSYNIVASGSKGNAVVVNGNILIDCGVSFKALKEVYKELQLVCLTHIHADHFRVSTIRKLAQERPTLRWATPKWLVNDLLGCGVSKQNIDVFIPNLYLKYGEQLAVVMKKIPHNVPNAAWIIFGDFGSVLYATDTNDISGITSKGLDLYLIEANYTESEIADRIKQKEELGEYCYEYDVIDNHLSQEKASAWLMDNMKENSSYVFLHQHEEKTA